MNGLKARCRELISTARWCREQGLPKTYATYLDMAGELRRTAFYIYGNRP